MKNNNISIMNPNLYTDESGDNEEEDMLFI